MKMIQRRLPRYYINNTNQSSPQQDIPDASLKQPQNRNSHSEVTVTDKDIKEVIENMAKTSVQDQTGSQLAFTKNIQINLSTL